MNLIPKTPPLQLGTMVPRLGKIVGIRSEGGDLGERYYFLIDKHGVVSFMPSDLVESSVCKKRGGA